MFEVPNPDGCLEMSEVASLRSMFEDDFKSMCLRYWALLVLKISEVKDLKSLGGFPPHTSADTCVF